MDDLLERIRLLEADVARLTESRGRMAQDVIDVHLQLTKALQRVETLRAALAEAVAEVKGEAQ